MPLMASTSGFIFLNSAHCFCNHDEIWHTNSFCLVQAQSTRTSLSNILGFFFLSFFQLVLLVILDPIKNQKLNDQWANPCCHQRFLWSKLQSEHVLLLCVNKLCCSVLLLDNWSRYQPPQKPKALCLLKTALIHSQLHKPLYPFLSVPSSLLPPTSFFVGLGLASQRWKPALSPPSLKFSFS